MARQPMSAPAPARSEMLARALEQIRQQGQNIQSPITLGTNLLATYLMDRNLGREQERERQLAEEADKPRREAQARLLSTFGGGGQPATPGQPQAVAMNAEGGGIAPMAPQQGGGIPSLGDPALQQALIAAQMAGVEGVGGMVDVLEAGQPQLQVGPSGEVFDARDRSNAGRNLSSSEYINNFRVNPNDPNAPAYLPELPEGGRPLYDEAGNPVGVQPLAGYLEMLGGQAAAQSGGAAAGELPYVGPRVAAEEAARSQFDIIEVQGPEGQTLTMPRSSAVALGLIEGPTPADTIRDTGEATQDVERIAEFGRARAYSADAERRAQMARDSLLAARQILVEGMDGFGGFSGEAGLIGSLASAVPGTRAYDLRAALEPVLGMTITGELQNMRDNSPTGGAMGSMAVREGEWLGALRGNLDQGQSPDQLLGAIDRALSEGDAISRNRREAFISQYGDLLGDGSSGAQTDAPRRLRYNPATGDFE
jgi:hypothetical protein